MKKEWTKKELNGLISKEIFTSEDIILPIWLEITAEEIYNYSPILADKVAISVSNNDIEKAISYILEKTKAFITTKKMITEKIEFLKNCNSDQQKKYILDTETRIKNLFHFQEAYYNWFTSDEAFGDNEWDDYLAEQKRNKLQKEYNIPNGVWDNPELSPGSSMRNLIKLTTKWIKGKLSIDEAEELYFVMNDYLDIDPHFILYGFPHSSIKDFEVSSISINGIRKIGLARSYSQEEYRNASTKVFNRYYLD